MADDLSTPEMDSLRSDTAKRGGSLNIPTSEQMFGWLRRWNWMATLFAVVSIGIAAPKFIDTKTVPDPGMLSVVIMPFVVLGTIGLNAIKEFYERQAERKAENLIAEQATHIGALEAENKMLKERGGG